MFEARFNDQVIARSDRTEVVEGNHYFPIEDVEQGFLRESATTSTCPWKGAASYYSVEVDGERADDAAWTYRDPSAQARQITDHVAFWRGVVVAPATS